MNKLIWLRRWVCWSVYRQRIVCKWARCSTCTDVHLCRRCWENKGHAEHTSQLHEYTWYNISSDTPGSSCDCCGFIYDYNNPFFKVWHCIECGDYNICKKCHREDMHDHHRQYFKLTNVSDYKKFIL